MTILQVNSSEETFLVVLSVADPQKLLLLRQHGNVGKERVAEEAAPAS